MIFRLVWKRIINRKLVPITTLLAFISIYTLTPIGLDQSKSATAIIQASIEKHGRGSYDILVRPSSSRTPIEQTRGIVEENYIGDSKGGISIKEWEEIKNDPDIEIAAPVASLGYFRGKQFSIKLPILDKPTLFTYQFFTSDGKSKYPLGPKASIMYFEYINNGLIQYLKDNHHDGPSIGDAMSFLMPENYSLLVAIDPESESKLTGIDFSDLNKEIKIESEPILQGIMESYNNPPIIKVLQRKDLNIPIFLELNVEPKNVELKDYMDLLNMNNGDWLMAAAGDYEKIDLAFEQLKKEKSLNSSIITLDLTNFQKPFDGTALRLNKQFEIENEKGSILSLDTSTYYVASKINYQNLETNPTVQIETPGNPPSYKKIYQKGISMETASLSENPELPFIIHQVGTFEPIDKQRNPLAGSPLGIYGENQAHLEDGSVLTPTTIPGSFVPSPANGVTTIESAELIKGERPIDAIRIKVAGISSYNEEGRKKIEKVTTKLLQKGYEVDVVAGSSFKEMTLDVEGIGKVFESWTTLGIAQELTDTWNVMNTVTTVLLSVFGVLWLIIRLHFERQILSHENGLLSVIGWNRQKIFLRNAMEQGLIILISLIVTVILLMFLHADKWMYMISVTFAAISAIISSVILLKKEKRKVRVVAYKILPSLMYYRHYLIPIMFVIILTELLISIQIASLGDAFYQSSDTTLGQFIGNQTRWFQIIVTIFVLYLSTYSSIEGLNTLFVERKQEFQMYSYIGWKKKDILKFIFKESALWFIPASLIGVLISFILLYLQHISIFWMFIGLSVAFSTISIIFIIILLSRRVITDNK
jgi:putative ABC transport system permease protein